MSVHIFFDTAVPYPALPFFYRLTVRFLLHNLFLTVAVRVPYLNGGSSFQGKAICSDFFTSLLYKKCKKVFELQIFSVSLHRLSLYSQNKPYSLNY